MFVDLRSARGVTAALAVVWLLLGATAACAQPRFRFDQMPGHLSKDVVPVRVDLTLDLDLDPTRDTFEGRVEVGVRVRVPVAAIELHAHELSAGEAWITDATPNRAKAGNRQALDVRADTEVQTWLLVNCGASTTARACTC